MASLAQKKLHFYSTIENAHSVSTPVESINCKFVTLPTLPVPDSNYIKLNFSTTKELHFYINSTGYYSIPEHLVPPLHKGKRKGKIFVDYGNGERDVYETEYSQTAVDGHYQIIGNNFISSIKLFHYDKPRVVTIWGDVHSLQILGPNFTTGGANTLAYRITSAEINGMSTLLSTNYMFSSHSGMTSVDLSEFDSSNLRDISGMFQGCSSLTTLDLSKLNTSKVVSFSNLFSSCSKLHTITGITNLDTTELTNGQEIFEHCSSLTTLDLSGWQAPKLERTSRMFYYCMNLTSVNLSGFTGELVYAYQMFSHCSKLQSLDVNHLRIKTNGLNTSYSESTSYMFQGCSTLTSLDLSSWNRIEVYTLKYMFSNCTNLETLKLPLAGIVSHDFTALFYNCMNLKTIENFDKINTKVAISFYRMFYNCIDLTTLDVSNFDTRSVTVTASMFEGCTNLTSLPGIENWDVRVLRYAQSMFKYTTNLSNVSFEKWCAPDVLTHKDFRQMSALQSEPNWSDYYCEYCCPLVNVTHTFLGAYWNKNREPDSHSIGYVVGKNTPTGYEQFETVSGEDVQQYSVEIAQEDAEPQTQVLCEYKGFDHGGKLCINVELSDGYTLNETEAFKNVTLNGSVIGSVKKIIQNGADKTTIFYRTDKLTCYEGVYGTGDTIALVEFVAPTPSPTPTPERTPTPTPSCVAIQGETVVCEEVALNIQSDTTTETDEVKDNSKNNARITTHGNVKHSSENKILNSKSSLHFDGNESFVKIEQASIKKDVFDVGDDDFTIEFWFNSSDLSKRQGLLSTNVATEETINDAKYDALYIGLEDRSVTYNENADNGTKHDTIFVMFRRDDMTTTFKNITKKIEANKWYHFAVVRSNNLIDTFLNGEPVDNIYNYNTSWINRRMTGGILTQGYDETTLDLLIGKFGPHYFNGYIQDLRITKKAVYENTCILTPTALFNTQSSLPSHATICSEVSLNIQSDTTNESNAIIDKSANSHVITKNGNVHHETDDAFIGESSLHFDGNGDYLSLPASNNWKLGSTDFTIEMWVYFDGMQSHTSGEHGGSSAIMCNATNDSAGNYKGWLINTQNDQVSFLYAKSLSEHWTGIKLLDSDSFVANGWAHIAIVKSGNILTGYVDGLKTESETIASWNDSDLPLLIGKRKESSITNKPYYFKGLIQDLRISKKAVYTQDCFAVPRDFASVCDPTPTPTPTPEKTPTPVFEPTYSDDELNPNTTEFYAYIPNFPEFTGMYVSSDGGESFQLMGEDGQMLAEFANYGYWPTDQFTLKRWYWTTRQNIFAYYWDYLPDVEINQDYPPGTSDIAYAYAMSGSSVSTEFPWETFKDPINNEMDGFTLHPVEEYVWNIEFSVSTPPSISPIEFRWADGIVEDTKILQVKNLLKPTHADGNFDERDMSAWSTLYTSNLNEDNHTLADAFWPDAAVSENYDSPTNIDFDGVRLFLDKSDVLPDGQLSNENYLQLYVDFSNSVQVDLLPSVESVNLIQPLYIYFGDNDDSENLASGKSDANSIIKKLASTTSTSSATQEQTQIEISSEQQSSFKVGMDVVISPNTEIEEHNVISGFGSLILQYPLQNNHPSGAIIQEAPETNFDLTPTPTSSPSPNACDGLNAIRCTSPYDGWNYPLAKPDANGNCYSGCPKCADDTRVCADNTKQQGNQQTRSYNLGCGFPECECNDTIPNGWNGPQFDPQIQDKEFRRVNSTECEVVPPNCDQAFKAADEAAASLRCQDECNGVAVQWNDAICEWECIFTECDQAKVNCLEQKAPDCAQPGETKTLKKVVDPNTCEYKECECIEIDPNNPDHQCLDKDGNPDPNKLKTIDPLTCEFNDCCTEEYIKSDCAGNLVRQRGTDCVEGPCECVEAEVDKNITCTAQSEFKFDAINCKWGCECKDVAGVIATGIPDPMCADPFETVVVSTSNPDGTVSCELECQCKNRDADPTQQKIDECAAINDNYMPILNPATCEWECKCVNQPENLRRWNEEPDCEHNGTQGFWQDYDTDQCIWLPECDGPDFVQCGPDQHLEYQYTDGSPCDPSVTAIKTFAGLSLNNKNEWENLFDGLTIKFGEQVTTDGVDYLPIFVKLSDEINNSSITSLSEWNRVYVFSGDNSDSDNLANGEGVNFDTIISNTEYNKTDVRYISAKIAFRFNKINGIDTLQVKNILKPTDKVFSDRDFDKNWSTIYIGNGFEINDNVFPSAAVDVNYTIGPISFTSLDCMEVCVDDPTPTPTFAEYYVQEQQGNDYFKFDNAKLLIKDNNEYIIKFQNLEIDASKTPDWFTGDGTINYIVTKKSIHDNFLSGDRNYGNYMYDSGHFDYPMSLGKVVNNNINEEEDVPTETFSQYKQIETGNYGVFAYRNGDDIYDYVGQDDLIVVMIFSDYNGTEYGPGSFRVLESLSATIIMPSQDVV